MRKEKEERKKRKGDGERDRETERSHDESKLRTPNSVCSESDYLGSKDSLTHSSK